ncbi:MAG: EAL domain-containing protein [Actinobacteria bacterium]|nr:MAG: EAL domain-containing protein [Actinomycetota bacterium]
MSAETTQPNDASALARASVLSRAEQLHWVVDRIAGGWLNVDANLHVHDIDARWTSITGQSVADAHGHGWIDVIDPSARLDFLDALRSAFATNEGVHGQLRLRHRDGTLRWLEFVGSPPAREDRGESAAARSDEPTMLSLFRDMASEVEAHHRAEEFTRLLDASADLVMIVDPAEFRLRWTNDALARFLQLDIATDTPLREILDPLSAQVFDDVARPALAHQSAWQGDLVFRTPSRGESSKTPGLPVSVQLVAHRSVDGVMTAISIVARDVSALLDAEQRLEASEIKLAALVEHASDIMCVIHKDGRVRYASPAFLPVLGYSPSDIEGTSVLNLVHIDDALIARETVRDVLDTAGLVKSLDIRVQHADGTWRHLEVVATNLVENTAVNGVVLNARDVTDRVHVAARLRERAFHDELTGLPNRALLLERLRDSLRRASGRGRLVGVLFLDLDRFKIVNDSLGHAAGDDLLREVARRIRETVRPDDTVARASLAARRLRKAISEPIRLGRDTAVVTTSVGITVAEGPETPEDLLRDSDTALYRAKERGRDRAHVFDDRLRDRAVRRLSVEQQLRRALDDGGFEVHYQPVVRVADRFILGGEALLRMPTPEGLVLPGQFIEIAEDAGLMTQLGATVFSMVCRDLASWTHPAAATLSIGVNVSARQLSDTGYAEYILDELATAGLASSRIYLELTEGSLVDNRPQTGRTLRQLHDAGIGLALDDFGTGFSSLAYLKRFPIDVLKIDRSFTDGLGLDENDTAIVKATIALAHSLGIRVVAEGVETEAQLSLLRTLGCDTVQGYLLGRPVPAAAFIEYVSS